MHVRAQAWIEYDRYLASSQDAAVLALVIKSLGLKEADPESERAKSAAARDAGIEEVTKAMEVLEKAYRKADKHWTLAAQAAGTTYLLVLFAFRLSKTAYVVAARELSIVFSAIIGSLWLGEGPLGPRLLGAGVILAGVACVALAR